MSDLRPPKPTVRARITEKIATYFLLMKMSGKYLSDEDRDKAELVIYELRQVLGEEGC